MVAGLVIAGLVIALVIILAGPTIGGLVKRMLSSGNNAQPTPGAPVFTGFDQDTLDQLKDDLLRQVETTMLGIEKDFGSRMQQLDELMQKLESERLSGGSPISDELVQKLDQFLSTASQQSGSEVKLPDYVEAALRTFPGVRERLNSIEKSLGGIPELVEQLKAAADTLERVHQTLEAIVGNSESQQMTTREEEVTPTEPQVPEPPPEVQTPVEVPGEEPDQTIDEPTADTPSPTRTKEGTE